METGRIPADSIPGPLDLAWTLESGQTFRWRAVGDDSEWYQTVEDGTVIEVRQREGGLDWRATTDPTAILRERLDLDRDLPAVLAAMPDEPPLNEAKARFEGLRLVSEPVVPTLFSFILSAQMRVERIHENVSRLRATYGEPIDWRTETVSDFPDPEGLAAASESELRDLGLGYRAPYVTQTAAMLRDDAVDLAAVREQSYESARSSLTEFVGVGPKVADCVLLFSMGFAEPVPLDTWIRTAIETHFPDANRDSYAATSRAIRERLGPHPGYAQTYLFTHLRTGGD